MPLALAECSVQKPLLWVRDVSFAVSELETFLRNSMTLHLRPGHSELSVFSTSFVRLHFWSLCRIAIKHSTPLPSRLSDSARSGADMSGGI